MRKPVVLAKPAAALRLSAACALALGVSACSSDTMRFSENPFSSPFRTAEAPAPRDPATTGSIGRGRGTPLQNSAPAIAAVRSQPLPPPQSAVALRSAPPTPVSGSAAGWSAQGGTPIVLAQGETLDTISSRYGVPKAALMSANGLPNGNVAPGTRLTIPVYNAAGAAPAAAPRHLANNSQVQSDANPEPARLSAPVAPRAAPPAPLALPPKPLAVAPSAGDAKAKAHAAAAAKAQAAADAKAKAAADAAAMRESRAKFAAEAKARAEAKAKAQPAARPVETAKVAPAKPVAPVKTAAPAKPVAPEKPKAVEQAALRPAAVEPKSSVPKSEPAPEPKTTASVPKDTSDESAKAEFRWPARGRVIAGFAGKGGNEGINIAVPEGTPVKAAEGGTVAYAGSELKGYGNLVLIRHPNGYVSAYAHNGELKVKRGETVKRGQVVAQSGQSGNVASPQLHFELRKGSSPVDPVPYLSN